MKTLICAVYDYKSDTYGDLKQFQNRPEAMRALQLSVKNQKESTLAQFPQDFGLFELGTYDNLNAEFEIHPKPSLICNAVDYKE